MRKEVRPEGTLPESYHLLDMGELAVFVNRHPQLIRKYYSDGLLPEPKYSYKHGSGKKTTRRFTIAEANAIKAIFDNMRWGALVKKRNRATKRKARRNN